MGRARLTGWKRSQDKRKETTTVKSSPRNHLQFNITNEKKLHATEKIN